MFYLTGLILFLVFFAFLAWFRPKWGLGLIVIFLPAYLIRFQVFGVPLTLLEAMILISFLAWLIQWLSKRQSLASWNGFKWWIIFFLLTATLAIFFSPQLKAALGFWKAYFIEPFLFFLVLINVIKDKRGINLLLWSLGASALMIFSVALWQYLGLISSPEPWILETPQRVTSLFEYPNAVGLYLAPLISLFLALGLVERKSKRQVFIWGVIIAGLLALIFSWTRGAFLGILAALVFINFFGPHRQKIRVGIILFLILILLLPQTRHLLLAIFTGQDVSTDVRVVMWQGTFRLLKARPLTGSGLAGFSFWYEKYRLIKHTEFLLYPHNIFLNFWAELGLFGLIIFLGLIMQFFRLGFKLLKEKTDFRPLIVGLIAAIVAMIVYGLVEVPYFKNDLAVQFWLILGFLILVRKLAKDKIFLTKRKSMLR